MKSVRMVLASALSVVLAIFGMAAAVAAPTPTSVPSTCVTYPPQVICQAHIMSSTTTPFQGQTIEVSGRGYHANEAVALTIGGISVGTAHTDGTGNFDPPAVVPVSLLGDQPLTGRGASGLPDDVDSLVLHITTSGASGTSTGSGLSNTGVKIAAFTAIAVALLAGGVLFTVAGRRRRNNSAHGS